MRLKTTGILLLAAATSSTSWAGTSAPSLLRPYELHSTGGRPEAVAIGDLDGDGRADVAMTTGDGAAGEAHRLLVFHQGPDGRLQSPESYSASTGGSVAIGDLNGDGRADVVVDGVGVFLQNARHKLQPMAVYPAHGGSLRVRVADFDGDGRADVASIPGAGGAEEVDFFLQEAGRGLGTDHTIPLGRTGVADLEAGDVTGDGRADLVVAGADGTVAALAVPPQGTAGAFGEPTYSDGAAAASLGASLGLGLGDVDGDGLADAVVASGAHLAVLPGRPGGGFASAVLHDSAPGAAAVEVADLDLDGRRDVVVLHADGVAGLYLQGAGGLLAAEQTFVLPAGATANPHGLAVGDVDSDGLPDVVAATGKGLAVLAGAGRVAPRPCATDGTALCLLGGRFEVRTSWRDQHNGGREGVGHPVSRSDASGTFWFFSPQSPELTVKSIDGQALNNRFWFFYGSLSDVEYRISVLDTHTGELRAYANPAGRICGKADAAAFAAGGTTTAAASADSALAAADAAASDAPGGPPPTGPPPAPTVPPGSCTPGPATLCLLGGRLRVETRWQTRDGATGQAMAVADSENGGFFWFFSPDNLELTVKALDGHVVNGRFWFFYGALSDVEYWIQVTDTSTGKYHVYHNAPGNFCGQGDVTAL